MDLIKKCSLGEKTTNYRVRYSKIMSLACMAIAFMLAGSTSFAAYHVYQIKHLNVFFEKNISMQQKELIGRELEQIEGVSSCQYISGDAAWEAFSESYLTPELTDTFLENPLAESDNYEVSISLNADTQEIRSYIEQLEGVRLVSDFTETPKPEE